MKFCSSILTASAISFAMLTGALAQDATALKGASPEEKARLEKLIEGAKQEGSVSYWDTVIQPPTNDRLVKAFKARYGLPASFKVNYTLAQTGDLVTRVEQELAAGRVSIDIASIAAPSWAFERAERGELMQYKSPEYKHYQQIFEAGLGKDGFFAFNGGYVFVPMWNSDNLDFKGKSYKDVIGAVPPGRLNHGDVANSTSYLATYIGQREVLPREFFEKLAAMKPVLFRRSEQIATGLVTGEQLMAFSGMPTRAYQYNKKGAKLKFIFPEEGVVLMPQNTFILSNAPHPNSAKLWIDFILSDEGQSILATEEALISGRTGFKSPLPEYSPSIDSLKLIRVDWKAINTEEMNKAKADWVSIFNP
jgi:iron(III) transport system substrate-binding protein